jgi:DNA polymerase III delta subunit
MDFSALAGGKALADVGPVWVFVGSESYLRDQGVELLKEAAPELGRNSVRLLPSETEWAGILSELYTPSFMGGRKLVVIADDGNFVHNHAKEMKEYAEAPSPTAVLVALVPSDKATGLKETVALKIVECKPLKPGDRARWAQSEFQRRGKSADRAAVDTLVRRGGEDLAGLAGHIANLVSYVGGRARVTADDVERLVVGRPEREVYELALATARKQPREALEIAHALLSSGEAAQVLLWRIAWQYRKLVEAKKLILAGRRRFEVTSLLQITYYPDEFLGLVDRHSLDELVGKHGEILGADVALKTSGGAERAIMEALVLKLAA